MKKENTIESNALELFADMLIKKIETINKDWKQPWFTEGYSNGYPRNIAGREYNGMNAFMLMMLCEDKGWKNPIFATFNKISYLNLQNKKEKKPQVSICKGEKGFPVFLTCFTYMNKETKEKISFEEYEQCEDKDSYSRHSHTKVYHVWNIEQTNLEEARPDLYAKIVGAPQEIVQTDLDNQFTLAKVDAMIEEQGWICPIETIYQNEAYYSISKDKITLPTITQFKDNESFYGTLFHEMTHSTGSEKYLNRLKPGSGFGSKEYAKEELVAEMGAALVAYRYGISKYVKEDSAAYLKSWLKTLREEPTFIKSVLYDVKKATAIIIDHIDKMK